MGGKKKINRLPLLDSTSQAPSTTDNEVEIIFFEGDKLNQYVAKHQETLQRIEFTLTKRKSPIVFSITVDNHDDLIKARYLVEQQCSKTGQRFWDLNLTDKNNLFFAYEDFIKKNDYFMSLLGVNNKGDVSKQLKLFYEKGPIDTVNVFVDQVVKGEDFRKFMIDINMDRELFFKKMPFNTILWFSKNSYKNFVQNAPDMYAFVSNFEL